VTLAAPLAAVEAHLARVEVTSAPEDTACPCCRAAMTVIGEDTSELPLARVMPKNRQK
jgi:transposase